MRIVPSSPAGHALKLFLGQHRLQNLFLCRPLHFGQIFILLHRDRHPAGLHIRRKRPFKPVYIVSVRLVPAVLR